MYQLLQDALPYLLGFYLLEGLMRVGPAEVLLWHGIGRWRARGAGVALAGLWPVAEAARLWDPPVLVTETAVLVPHARAAHPALAPEDLERWVFESGTALQREGRTVRCGGRLVLTAPSEAAAETALDLLRSIVQAPSSGRVAGYRRWLDAAADLDRVRGQIDRARRGAGVRRALAATLFLATFGLVPLFLATPAAPALGWLLLGILLIHATLVTVTLRSLRRTESRSIKAVFASMALFPPSAMHAPLHVTKDLFSGCHPLAAAAVLLPRGAFENLARRERHRLEVALEAARGTETDEAWRTRIEILERIVAAGGLDVGRVRAAPPRIAADAAAYCPLCFSEYRAGFDACSDCGTALKAF